MIEIKNLRTGDKIYRMFSDGEQEFIVTEVWQTEVCKLWVAAIDYPDDEYFKWIYEDEDEKDYYFK